MIIYDYVFCRKLDISQKIKESLAAREVEARRQVIAKRKAQDEEIRAWRTHLETFKISKSCQLKRTGIHSNEVSSHPTYL